MAIKDRNWGVGVKLVRYKSIYFGEKGGRVTGITKLDEVTELSLESREEISTMRD